MKEIELLKTIFKDSPDILESLNEISKEIERLNKAREIDIEYNRYLQKELAKANNIIKEVKSQIDYLETYSSKEDVFEDMKRRLDRIDKIIGSDKE